MIFRKIQLLFLLGIISTYPIITLASSEVDMYISSVIRNIVGTTDMENSVVLGNASADSPVCVASGQTSQPCQVSAEFHVLVDFNTLLGKYEGELNVIGINPTFHSPEVIAKYPVIVKSDSSQLFTTFIGTLNGRIKIPGQGEIPFTGNLYLPVGFVGTTYPDGTPVHYDVLGKPAPKLVFRFD